jgi:hypothetical protein
MNNLKYSNLLHISLSDNISCGVRQHVEVLNFQCEVTASSLDRVIHFPFRRNGFLFKLCGYLEISFEVLYKRSGLVIHEYVRLSKLKRLFLATLSFFAKDTYVLNSRTYWMLSKLGIDVLICPSFSPQFNNLSPSKGIFYRNTVHFLGIQDDKRSNTINQISISIANEFKLIERNFFVADKDFFKHSNLSKNFQCSDFPSLNDLSGKENFVVLFTFPGIDENRSMAIALFEADFDGLIICSELILNLFSCISNIKRVNTLKHQEYIYKGIFIGISKNIFPISVSDMELYSVSVPKDALNSFFSISNAKNYWTQFKS